MIRFATKEDIETIAKMGGELNESCSFKNLVYDVDKVKAGIENLISNGFAAVSERDGVINGFFLGDVYTPWHTTDKVAVDYALYITPEYRHGMVAMRLLLSFEKWCQLMGAKQIRLGVSTGISNVERLYERLGHERTGGQFVKDI